MLMTRHGVIDGRPQAHGSLGERLITRWIPFVECLSGGVLSSPEAEFKTAFRDLAACTDDYREVAL
jgi:hypothetical protein